MILEIADQDTKLNILAYFGLKLVIRLIFMKFRSQNKSAMVVMNILILNDDLDPKFGSTIEELSRLMKFDTKNK